MHPGEPLPSAFKLNPGDKQGKMAAVNKSLEAIEGHEQKASEFKQQEEFRKTMAAMAVSNRRDPEAFQEKERGRGLLDKAETEYRKASSHADALASFIEAAKAGNKVAASAQALEGTLSIVTSQGVTRINRTELGTTEGAGSLWDRITGKIDKWKEGQPIPPDVQKGFIELAGLLKKNSYDTYLQAHKSAVKRYGLEGEEPLPNPGGETGSGTEKTVAMKGPDGTTYDIPASKVAAAKKAHPDWK
jgi:hypothetical protein